MAAQSAVPLARLIESIKAIPGMWDRTVIAIYSADGGCSPSANSYGNEGKSSFVLAGGRIRGGYFGDVRVAGNTGTGHTWSYVSPDDSGAAVVPVSGGEGRVPGRGAGARSCARWASPTTSQASTPTSRRTNPGVHARVGEADGARHDRATHASCASDPLGAADARDPHGRRLLLRTGRRHAADGRRRWRRG
ncbi:MAG: hypothetical protein U0168_20710 [Nannocystaceae bacterium]